MSASLTDLEKGVFVKIDPLQFYELIDKMGFLSRENYPDFYEEIAVEGEIGRFVFFRFISE